MTQDVARPLLHRILVSLVGGSATTASAQGSTPPPCTIYDLGANTRGLSVFAYDLVTLLPRRRTWPRAVETACLIAGVLMARGTRQITSFFRWAWALLLTAACGTMAHAELLYVSLPQSSSNAVITYDLSLGSATAIRNSQQTFASGTVVAAPQGMAIDPLGNVFVADQLNYSISKFDSSGTLLAIIGSAASLNYPMGLALDSAGTLYAANYGGQGAAANTVARFDADGNFVASMTAQIDRPVGVAVDTGGHLFVGNWFLNTISKFDASGTFLASIGSSTTITNPGGLVTSATGELYVANEGSGVISLFDAARSYQSSIGAGASLLSPAGVASDRLGNLYVSSGTDSSNALISKFDSTGVFQFAWSIPNVSGFLATAPVPVPEPATWIMAVAGLASVQLLCRQHRRKPA